MKLLYRLLSEIQMSTIKQIPWQKHTHTKLSSRAVIHKHHFPVASYSSSLVVSASPWCTKHISTLVCCFFFTDESSLHLLVLTGVLDLLRAWQKTPAVLPSGRSDCLPSAVSSPTPVVLGEEDHGTGNQSVCLSSPNRKRKRSPLLRVSEIPLMQFEKHQHVMSN